MKKIISFLMCTVLFLSFLFCLEIDAGPMTSLSWPDDTPLYILEAGDSPYFIDTSFVVEQGNILIIEPGVTMLFGDSASLVVRGRLKAEGRRGRKIIFDARDKRKPWNGIYFDSAEKISQIKYCTISRAKGIVVDRDDIYFTDSLGGAITAIDSNLKVEFCVITKNKAEKGGAIFSQDSELFFKGNLIRKNKSTEGGACYFYLVKAIFISNKIVKNRASNIAGSIISYESDLTFVRNRIVSNKAGVEGGIYQEGSNIVYRFNTIARNRGKKPDADYVAEVIKERPGKHAIKETPAAPKVVEKKPEEPAKTPAQIKNEIVASLRYINRPAYLPRKFSPYRISRDIVIAKNGILEIQPGTVLEMAPNTGVKIEGKIIARGSKTRKIYFKKQEGKKSWKNIMFLNAAEGSVVEWCVIANGSGRDLRAGSGGAFSAGGALSIINSKVTVKNTSFELNNAEYGGAVYIENANLVLDRNSFQKNMASKEGGALYARASDVILTGNDFFENSAKINGAVMYLFKSESEIIANNMYQNTAPKTKGIILCRGSRPKIRNNQILKNTGRRIVVEPESAELKERQLIEVIP